ncbi:hypothetical protein MKW98_023094 [Papaver atlanticum]|uniref:non-specific serine/threonine protein kinase n=1 Tax=Papaver atlanticum TaxID=357466 RepID=A0AAD4XUD1_9MAGN|nr:hypothetical protein MKW98_023094 [Papaver atlanticum]
MKKYCFFFVTSLLFLYNIGKEVDSSSSGVGFSKDVEKLLAFKSKLINPSVLQNWVQNQDPCYFTGVSCNNNKDSVSGLDLSFVNLNLDFKFVSSFLMSLDSLEKLSLRFSNLTGNLSSSSSESSCSEKLQELDLSGNRLTGSISDISSLSSCSNLVSLNLSRNSLGGENKDYSGLKLPPSLQNLDLSTNNFTGKIPSLSPLGVLNHLDLSANKFSGEIGRYFTGFKSLSYLNLSNNEFSGRIPVISSGNLQYLLLSTNSFNGEIPLEITDSCTTLMEIDLSFNQLIGSLPSGLASCTSLEQINLSNNSFSGEFPSNTLIQMTKLKKLILSYNYFDGEVHDSISKLTNLEMLDLSANNLSGLIPPGLCENVESNLKELYLQNNMFTGIVPSSLSKCSKLITLDLSSNYLTGTIPSSFGSLSQLRDLIMWLNQLTGEIPTELENIKTLENLILDNNGLTGGIPSGLSNCTNLNWISLSSNLLSGEIPSWIGTLNKLAILKLGNNSFSGVIPAELGDCRSLIWLDLNSNSLSGSIPATLSKQAGNIAGGLVAGKRYVYLKNDGSPGCHGAGSLLEFAGIRPEGLDRVPTRRQCNFTRVYMGNTQYTFNNNGSMIFLDLSYNKLENSIPKELGDMYYLSVLNLGHNNLTGAIPNHFGNLKNVGILDLSFNKLKGPIPGSLSGLTLLAEIDLSNNKLSGLIPEGGQLATFPPYRYQNNDGLCGYPLPPCGDSAANSSASAHPKSHRRQASLAGSVAMGLLFSLFCIFGVIIVIVERNKRQKKKEAALDIYIDSRSHSGTAHTNWKLTSVREALSINLSTFDRPLRKLTFADLLEATNGFHNDSLIGSGGFGDVYKAQLKDGSIVAVKKLIQISGQGDREFTAEMETIGKVKHRNLVPLLGYCKVGEERLLVYEYMRFGSLEDVLHDRKKGGIKLKWSARRKIAIGAAKGLAFLHHMCVPHIIHRDMKSSNVLLDENLEARVSDFGMARLMSAMDTHLSVSTLAGTPGYVPPEYYQSFRCSAKGDVYSYGVVLLELLTGKQPTDSADFGDNNLVGWVKQHAKLKISDVFDPELMKEDPTLEIELLQHLKVACACLDDRPWRRPTMIQVMAMFKEIQAGSSIDSSVSTIDQDGSFHTIDMVEMTIKEGQELHTKH